MVSSHRGQVDVRFGSQGRRSQSGESREHTENQTQDKMEREGGPQLPRFCQGWAGVFICQVQGVGDNIRYAEKVGKWGKGKKKC